MLLHSFVNNNILFACIFFCFLAAHRFRQFLQALGWYAVQHAEQYHYMLVHVLHFKCSANSVVQVQYSNMLLSTGRALSYIEQQSSLEIITNICLVT